ncbi:MAG: AIR carboxylase family protein [Anaerolineae bacterium]|nr:AIR carboxylase family protein [Anaerolineae bacterium]
MLVVIVMGSPSDSPGGQRVAAKLTEFGIRSEIRIASAHKTPAYLLEMLDKYEESPEAKVYVTIAGRSNALSGMIDAQVTAPVIACPPYSDKFGGGDVYSSLRAPSGVAPAVVMDPENAALLAAKILGLANPDVAAAVSRAQSRQRERLFAADEIAQQVQDPRE